MRFDWIMSLEFSTNGLIKYAPPNKLFFLVVCSIKDKLCLRSQKGSRVKSRLLFRRKDLTTLGQVRPLTGVIKTAAAATTVATATVVVFGAEEEP